MADPLHIHCSSRLDYVCHYVTDKIFTHALSAKRSHVREGKMAHALARTYPLPHGLEAVEERFATLALVRNVTNCAQLRSQASAGLIEAALLNPRLV